MTIRTAIELLEPRRLLSGVPNGQHGLESVEGGIVDGVGLQAGAAAAARTPQNSPLPMSMLLAMSAGPAPAATLPTIGPMMVAPRLVGGAGGPLGGPNGNSPSVHTSDSSAEGEPTSEGKSSRLDGPEPADVSHGPPAAASQPVDQAMLEATRSESSPSAVDFRPLVDACFVDDAWALSVEDAVALQPEAASGLSELDLLVAAVGIGATIHLAAGDALPRHERACLPRR